MDDDAAMSRPRTAVVAGGTGALGTALVELLLDRGERVCVPWVVEQEAEALRERRHEAVQADRLRLSRCDATDPDQLAALLDVLVADWGPLWAACSAVGGWAGGETLEELGDLADLDRMLHLNLRSAYALTAAALRRMGPSGGRVVLVGARAAERPPAGQAAYAASKAAVHALVASAAAEVRGTGRTVNAVVPTVIDTPANRRAMPDADHDRWPTTERIAAAAAWLAGDDAGVVNGALLPVPGAT